MKRRSFLLASGSTILSGGSLSVLQKPSFALDFELTAVPDRNPSNIDSVLVSFSKFKLTPRYVDSEKDAQLNINVKIGSEYSESTSKTIPISNGDPIISDDIGSELPISVTGINTSQKSIQGKVSITVEHDSIGSKNYNQEFVITNNALINGLVSYYPMVKNAGLVIHDAIDNKDGQIQSATWSDSGYITNSIEFDNTSEEIDIGDTGIGSLNNWTVSYWAYPNSNQTDGSSNWKGIVSNGDANNDGGWSCHYKHDVTDWVITHSGDYPYNNGLNVTASADTDQWQLVTWTYDGDKVRIYKNGSEVDSDAGSQSYASDTNNMFIGKYIWRGQQRYWDGRIEDIRIYNRALSPSEVDQLYNIGNHSGSEITENDIPSNDDGGVSRYKLNGNPDDSWSSNNGNDTSTSGYLDGVYNDSKSFDGTSGYIEIPDDSSLGLTNLTVSLWAYRNGSKSKEYLFDGRDHNYYIKLDDDTNKPLFGGYINGNGTSVILDNPIPNKKWVHIVGTYDGDKLRLYVDAELRKTNSQVSGGFDTSSGPARIGDYIGDNYKFKGRIDDVRIYNRALTDDEVQRLFSLGSYEV